MPYIYQIKCLENDKRYIGYTADFSKRKTKHLSALRKCRSHCDELQRDFDVFGESNFEFSVIMNDCSKEDEKDLINKISFKYPLYNREYNPNKQSVKPYILDRDKRVNIYMTYDLQNSLKVEAKKAGRNVSQQIKFYIEKSVAIQELEKNQIDFNRGQE